MYDNEDDLLAFLTDAEYEEYVRALQERDSPAPEYCPHTPTDKQSRFLELGCLEAFYGGAAGGGKSDALLMAALQYVEVPHYAAIIFRKTFSDLALDGALMDRALDWMGGTSASWNGGRHVWTFPSGATLSFGYLEAERHKYRYRSAEFQYIAFDELTQFTETQYRYLFSRLRKQEGMSVPLRMRSASNPGDIGHVWVKKRFITNAAPGVVFVPARLSDNPHLNQEEYTKSLMNLDPIERERLLRGDWDVTIMGNKFAREWFRTTTVLPKDLERVRWWDLSAGGHDRTAGVLLGRSPEGLYYVIDVKLGEWTPREVERKMLETASHDGKEVPVWTAQDPGQAGVAQVDHLHRVLEAYDFHSRRESGDKGVRANPVASQAEAGNVLLREGSWNENFIDELALFPHGQYDDQVDALSGAYNTLAGEATRYHAVKPESIIRESPWKIGEGDW
ncbi:MAG: phage terminase large subunit [Vicinamibacterales bacterium]